LGRPEASGPPQKDAASIWARVFRFDLQFHSTMPFIRYHENKNFNFSADGMVLENPKHCDPEKYTMETKAIKVKLPAEIKITDQFAENLGKSSDIDDKMCRQNIKKGNLKFHLKITILK
jgi:hypothetical protein